MPGGIHPPIEVLLAFPKPNYIDPVRRGWEVPGMVIFLLFLTICVVAARLWARLVLQRNAGIDDIIIVIAMIPTISLAISIVLATRVYGFDRHVWDLKPGYAIKSRQITMAIEASYIASTSLTKVSILLFYRRMATGSISPFFHWAVRTTMIFVVCYAITFELTLFLGCHPIDSFWNQVDFIWEQSHVVGRDYHCFNESANVLSASAISIIQDFLACGLPVTLFWKLQLPFRQKCALAAVFGVGFFLCITGVLRIYYIYNLYFTTYDVTWAASSAWAWTGVEAHIAIICASAPALKAFFKEYFNVSGLGGSLPLSWQRSRQKSSGTAPTGKSEKTGSSSVSPYSSARTFTSKSKQSKNATTLSNIDVELGGIAITREVEIASAYGSEQKRAVKDNDAQSTSSQRWLRQNGDPHFPGGDVAWLDDQSSPATSPRAKSPPPRVLHAK